MGHRALAGLLCLCLVITVEARAKRSKRQVDPNSDPFGPGSNTNGQCRPLPAPTFGTINCGDNIPFYRCTAKCNQGYIFETGDTSMDKDCDMMTGQFFGGSNFPKCKLDPNSDPFGPGSNTNGQCRPLPAPTFGTINCGDNSPFYRCTAKCNQGYIFETGDTSMDKDCDMMTGQFFGGSNFPKCKPICSRDCGGTCISPNTGL